MAEVAADPVAAVVACNAAVEAVCNEEADPVAAYNAAEVDPAPVWSAAAVDLAAGFHPKALQVACSVKAQRWGPMAVEA